MDDPARAERLWIAIATWWLLSFGGAAEAQADKPLDIIGSSVTGAVRLRGKHCRMVGIFQHGWSLIVAGLLNHELLPVKPGCPEAWPKLPEIHSANLAAYATITNGLKTYTCKRAP